MRGGRPTGPLTTPLTALSDMARHNFDGFQKLRFSVCVLIESSRRSRDA